ncbi:MAG: hypothetical protein V1784_04040 [bacterium]
MTKEEIKERLLEPFEKLSDEERAEIEAYAERDAEIRQALEEARAFSNALQRAQVLREPDADTWSRFLPGVRARIDARTRRKPLWQRRPVLIPVFATALLALVLATGRFGPNSTNDFAEYTSSEIADAIPELSSVDEGLVLTEQDYQNLSDLGVDAASLAAALEVESIDSSGGEFVPESELDAPPLIDEVLALSESEIDELLAKLEATRFI